MSAAIAANQHTPSGALVTASNLCSVPHNSETLPGRNRWESLKIHGALRDTTPLHKLKRSVRVLCAHGSDF